MTPARDPKPQGLQGLLRRHQGSTWEPPRKYPGATQEVPRSTQKAPRDTRELTRRPDRSGRQNHQKQFSFTAKTT